MPENEHHKVTLEQDSKAGPPKAILVLALDDPSGGDVHGPAKVHLLFNMETFPADPSNPSDHDNKTCAFTTDKVPGALHVGSVVHPAGIGARESIRIRTFAAHNDLVSNKIEKSNRFFERSISKFLLDQGCIGLRQFLLF